MTHPSGIDLSSIPGDHVLRQDEKPSPTPDDVRRELLTALAIDIADDMGVYAERFRDACDRYEHEKATELAGKYEGLDIAMWHVRGKWNDLGFSGELLDKFPPHSALVAARRIDDEERSA